MLLQAIAQDITSWQTEKDCEDFLFQIRWANGYHCPRCDHDEAFQIRSRTLLECKACRMQVSITAGTVMHKSKLPLLTWFRAIQFLFQNGNDASAYSLAILLRINYRSAKLLMQKICYAFQIEFNRLEAFKQLKNKKVSPTTESSQAFESTDLQKAVCDAQEIVQNVVAKSKSLSTIYAISRRVYQRFYLEFQGERGRIVKGRSRASQIAEKLDPRNSQRTASSAATTTNTAIMWDIVRKMVSVYLYTTFFKCYQLG
ncbi:transposase [Paenibacillus whitsoniae]|uniref:IS1595 family transposase n=1 Tax=Paenibacillus whitsoniae TaxID=2496558 RepID=A0A430JFD3_9BACL|nr:transposase [Paenibacillus whitsoniae]RTE09738.1 IS1595 family transposase [Paenibacillus whitsoniae]